CVWAPGARFSSSRNGFAADEMFFLKIDCPAEADFKRRIFLRWSQRLFDADIIDLQQDKSRLETRNVKGKHTRGLDAEVLAVLHENIPNLLGVFRARPNLVAEITGVPRT